MKTRLVLPRSLMLCMIVFLSALLATAQRGSANTITVNSLANTQANDGVCTLREAIINANNDDQSGSTDCAAGSGADTINIVVPGEIVLNGTAANLPTITSDMTINGLGANQTTITGPLSGGAGFNGSYRCFFVQSGNVTISNMTIRKGVTPLAQSGNGDEVGGGILNVNGSLTLNGVTVTQCQAGKLHFQNGTTGFLAVGGGVGSLGPLTITNCTFTNNAAYGGNGTSTGGAAGGGAIYIQGFPLTITGSTIDPNQAQSGQGSNTSSVAYGGGIYAGDSTVTISNSSISHNVANSDSQAVTGTAEGGGITVVGTGTLTVNNNSQILSNKCFSPDPTGGGSSPNAPVYGGGIYTESATTISDSSVSSNSAQSGNISNGWAGPVAGGGIYSKAPLTITNTHVDSNSLTQGNSNIGENAWGGGIFWNVDGTNGTALTITGSSISSNKINAFTDSGTGSNHSQSFGGGLALFGPVTSGSATFSLTNSQVLSNSVVGATYNTTSNSGGDAAGGGMWLVSHIAVTITNTSISNNSVVGGSGTTLGSAEGGGIDNGVSLPMSISGSTISGNSATDQEGAGYGGGISNGATVSITDTTLSGNSGINGGAINNRFTTNTLKLLRCTLSGNSCTASGFTGGAIDNSGTLFATNSTFSGNLTPQCTTGECGGAVWSANAATLTNCTLTNNQTVTGTSAPNVTGIFRYDGTVTLKDTIVAGNVNPSTFADVFFRTNGTTGSGFVSQGYNLIGNVGAVTTFTQIGDQTGTSAIPLNPKLGPLINNGGATLTHQPFPGSPALDKGAAATDPILNTPITTDQRGMIRPFDDPAIPNAPGGNGSDIGAVEGVAILNVLTVTKTADTNDGVCDADCSLREALTVAGGNGRLDTIVFNIPANSPGCNGTDCTITLNSPLTPAADNGIPTTINGYTGPNTITLSGPNSPGFIDVGSGVNLALTNLNITACYGTNNNGPITIESGGSLTITNCALYSNGGIGPQGGALTCLAGGVLNLTNVSLFQNQSAEGGAIYNSGTTTATNVTITANFAFAGGGVSNTGTFNIRNTIIAENSGTQYPNYIDVKGNFTSQGHNLIGRIDGSSGFGAPGDQWGTSAAPLSPQLAAAANNGGPTRTLALQSNSPAINAGDTFAPTYDQRYQLRNGTPDIGAYEYDGLTPSLKVTAITYDAAGPTITLQALGVANAPHSILWSSSPTTNFSYLGSATSDASGTVLFDDVQPTAVTKRFYRITFP